MSVISTKFFVDSRLMFCDVMTGEYFVANSDQLETYTDASRWGIESGIEQIILMKVSPTQMVLLNHYIGKILTLNQKAREIDSDFTVLKPSNISINITYKRTDCNKANEKPVSDLFNKFESGDLFVSGGDLYLLTEPILIDHNNELGGEIKYFINLTNESERLNVAVRQSIPLDSLFPVDKCEYLVQL